MWDKLKNLLIKHEGFKLKPYKCTAGKLTIGIGRNLDDKGIEEDEAFFMLHNDISECEKSLNKFSWFKSLDEVRQCAVMDMVFNLGIARFLLFKQLIQALEIKNYTIAGAEMLDSKWSQQVGQRAKTLSNMMLTGKYPKEIQ
jgi:lysozyme